jgi:hypothetical protein
MQAFFAAIITKLLDKYIIRFFDWIYKAAKSFFHKKKLEKIGEDNKKELNDAIKEGKTNEEIGNKGKDFLNGN